MTHYPDDNGPKGFRDFMHQHFPRRSVRRGMLAGSLLAVLAATGVLSAVHLTDAKPFDENGGSIMAVSASTPQPVQPTPAKAAPAAAPAATPQAATTTANGSIRYVALGDSVAAGIGLAPLANPSGYDRACKRSSQAYSHEVGRQLGLKAESAACSGATAGDLNTPQGVDGPNPPSQLSAAFAGGVPGLISITAGANDVRWKPLIQSCYVSNCATKANSTFVDGLIAIMEAKYAVGLENIRFRSSWANSQPPKVIMTGYYHPVSAACQNDKVSHAELVWINGMVDKVNHHLNALATSPAYKDFVRFAPVDFTGHDLCSADPWIQGLTAAEPVHPTAEGQQAIARSVVQAAKR